MQMHVHDLRPRIREKGFQGAGDSGMSTVQGKAQRSKLDVARTGEVRQATAWQVLYRDSHAEVALGLLKVGEGAQAML